MMLTIMHMSLAFYFDSFFNNIDSFNSAVLSFNLLCMCLPSGCSNDFCMMSGDLSMRCRSVTSTLAYFSKSSLWPRRCITAKAVLQRKQILFIIYMKKKRCWYFMKFSFIPIERISIVHHFFAWSAHPADINE